MINVCTGCLRLNPLGLKQCNYCQGICQEIKSLDFGQFCIKQQKQTKEEDKNFEDLLLDYPDLKIFADYANMANPWEIIFARP